MKRRIEVFHLLALLLAGAAMGSLCLPAQAADVNQAPSESGSKARIAAAMKAMRRESAALGEPRAENGGLFFGSSRMNGKYAIVDGIMSQFGCTATFFVKKGADYVRISTNVLRDGDRSVGTVLDPHGAAYAAIERGTAHYGVVDILGRKYQAGYEPIKNNAGVVIGAWYVGVLLESGAGI